MYRCDHYKLLPLYLKTFFKSSAKPIFSWLRNRVHVLFTIPFCSFSIVFIWQSLVFGHKLNLFTLTLALLIPPPISPTSPSPLLCLSTLFRLCTVARDESPRSPLFCFTWRDPNCFGQERHCCLWWKPFAGHWVRKLEQKTFAHWEAHTYKETRYTETTCPVNCFFQPHGRVRPA